MTIGPALVLAVIVGLFHVSAYVFIRGRAGARLPFLAAAAVLGAWAGDVVGARLAIDPIRVGEFNMLMASFVAWLGIGLVAILATLVPARAGDAAPRGTRIQTVVTRSGGASGSSTADAPSGVASTASVSEHGS